MEFSNKKAFSILTTLLLILGVSKNSKGEELDWDSIQEKAPPTLKEVGVTKRSALFVAKQQVTGSKQKGVFGLGFFISKDGLALCSAMPLCQKSIPKFRMGNADRTLLPSPKLLAIFPDEKLALLRFNYKPKEVLSIAKKPTPVGTWVSLLSPSLAPDPIQGPILAHRTTGFFSPLKNQKHPMKQFSIAASGAPGRQEEFTTGSPFIDAKGQVVAIFSQSIPLPAQTYRLAAPTIDLSDRIEKVVRAGLKLEIPIPEEQQPFDPAVFSEEYSALSEAVIKGELARARRHSATLMEKYPDSVFAKFSHLSALSALFFSGAMEPTVLTEFVEQLKVPENAAPWARGIYHFQLGETLNKEEKTEDAITHYQKSDELYPDGMACATLAIFFERKRQKEKAEHYARRAVAFEPDRISYWDTLQRILFAQGKFKEARVAKARISLLEKLYSIR